MDNEPRRGAPRYVEAKKIHHKTQFIGSIWQKHSIKDSHSGRLDLTPLFLSMQCDCIENGKHQKWGYFGSKDSYSATASKNCAVRSLESTNTMAPMWKKWMKLVDLGEPTSCFDPVNLGCTQRECKPNESIIEECNRGPLQDQLRNHLGDWNFTSKTVAWSYDMDGLSNCSKSQPLAWTTTVSRKEELVTVGELSENVLADCIPVLGCGQHW